MNPELQNVLQECGATAQTLLSLLKWDQKDMSDCVNGEILDTYSRGNEEAAQMARSIQEELRLLLEDVR